MKIRHAVSTLGFPSSSDGDGVTVQALFSACGWLGMSWATEIRARVRGRTHVLLIRQSHCKLVIGAR